MDEDLITKKELLELTGISYGALYRWKRMKLLPDEWFIHRSTFTGHETFLPREKVLARVQEIQTLKSEMSLEEIAQQYQPATPGEIALSAGEIAEAGIAQPFLINQYLAATGKNGAFGYNDLLGLFVFSGLLQEGCASRDEALEVSQAVVQADSDLSEPIVYFIRKYGVPFCVTAGEMQKIIIDPNAVVAKKISVSEMRTKLSQLLKEKGMKL